MRPRRPPPGGCTAPRPHARAARRRSARPRPSATARGAAAAARARDARRSSGAKRGSASSMAIAWSALLGGAVSIGSSTKPNICSVAKHSTGVRNVGCRCDSSPVAHVTTSVDSLRDDRSRRFRTDAAAPGRALATAPPRVTRWDGLARRAADRRDAAGGPVRAADLRELGDRPAGGADAGGDRRRSRPRTRCSSRSSSTCAAMRTSAPRPDASPTSACPGEQLLIIPPGAEAPLPEELARLQRPKPLLEQWLELFFGPEG